MAPLAARCSLSAASGAAILGTRAGSTRYPTLDQTHVRRVPPPRTRQRSADPVAIFDPLYNFFGMILAFFYVRLQKER